MRAYHYLNKEHDDKIKRTTCCRCPEGKELIFCGCECHKEQGNSFACIECGKVYSEESGAYTGFICDECDTKREG